jgi:hypothetical protein
MEFLKEHKKDHETGGMKLRAHSGNVFPLRGPSRLVEVPEGGPYGKWYKKIDRPTLSMGW